MPYCAVLQCKNDSRTKNRLRGGISYHRFPNNPNIKEKWIDATGRLNWMPVKSSCICSEHFVEKSFLTSNKGYIYLIEHAVPTQKIMMHGTQCKHTTASSNTCEDLGGTSSDMSKKKHHVEDSSSIPPAEQSSVEIEESNALAHVQTCSKRQDTTDEEIFETPNKKAQIEIDIQKDSDSVIVVKQPAFADCKENDVPFSGADPRDTQNCTPCGSLYSTPNKKTLGSMLRWSRNIIKKKNLKIKRLQTQNRRLKRKIESVEQLLKEFEEKFANTNENLTCLKNTNVEVSNST